MFGSNILNLGVVEFMFMTGVDDDLLNQMKKGKYLKIEIDRINEKKQSIDSYYSGVFSLENFEEVLSKIKINN